MLEMRQFKILCENQAVVQILTKKSSENFSAQVLRHLQFISKYSTDCEYIQSEENSVADDLTRTGVALIHDLNKPLDFAKLQMLKPVIPKFRLCATKYRHCKSKDFQLIVPKRQFCVMYYKLNPKYFYQQHFDEKLLTLFILSVMQE